MTDEPTWALDGPEECWPCWELMLGDNQWISVTASRMRGTGDPTRLVAALRQAQTAANDLLAEIGIAGKLMWEFTDLHCLKCGEEIDYTGCECGGLNGTQRPTEATA